VLDFYEFEGMPPKRAKQCQGSQNQALGATWRSFPTNLSTDFVDSSKKPFRSCTCGNVLKFNLAFVRKLTPGDRG
jgi:hypothetical protein